MAKLARSKRLLVFVVVRGTEVAAGLRARGPILGLLFLRAEKGKAIREITLVSC